MFSRTFRWYDRLMTRLDPRLTNIVMFLLGFLMVLYGICTLLLGYDGTQGLLANVHRFCSLIITQAGFAIILDPDRNYVRCAVLFAFQLGLYRFFNYFLAIMIRISGSEPMTYPDYATVALYIILVIISLFMIVSAQAIQMGFAFRRNALLTSQFIILITAVLQMVVLQFTYDGMMELIGVREFQHKVLEFILFVFVIYIMESDHVRNRSTWGKHSVRVGNIRDGYVSDKNAFIFPEDASSLTDPTLTDWKMMMDCGPVEKEFRFHIHGKYNAKSTVIVQRWKDDPRYHMTMAGELGASIINANRIMVDTVFVQDKRIHFAGKDGTDVSFAIRYGGPDDVFGFEVADI